MTEEPEPNVKPLRPKIVSAAEPQPESPPLIEGAPEIGDVVRLNSAEVEMTVTRLTGSGKAKQYVTTWFSIEGELGEATFDGRCLRIVRKAAAEA